MSPVARTTRIAVGLSIVAVVARFIWIDQPYIDRWSWRQSDVASIARNFFQNGFHFSRPQIDWAGDQPGYVGTEFPILPFIAALCYKFFGVHEWIGRSQAVIFFTLSLPFFFLIVRQIFGPIAAVWSLFFYSFAPLNVMASRCFTPDVPSLSLTLIGLYFFMRWIEHRQRPAFFMSAITLSLSILIKVTSAIIGLPMLYLIVGRLCQTPSDNGISQRRPTIGLPLQSMALYAGIALLPSAIWYWHAWQIGQTFYPYHLFGEGGISIENLAWYWDIAWRTFGSGLTPLLSILALIGLFIAPRRKFTWAFHWWLVAMVLFIIIAGYGNRHPWYQLPLVPISCAFAGAACAVVATRIDSSTSKWVLSIFLVVAFLCPAVYYSLSFYEPVAGPFRNAGLFLKKTTPSDALIVAADDGNPTLFYYAERKGWHFPEEDGMWQGAPRDSEEAKTELEQLRKRGARYFVFPKDTTWWLNYYPGFTQYLSRNAKLMIATNEFRIYRLE
jgi:4-amino-4-deoxy-L-arabinose transferase-like glycosyltransferase